MIKKYDIHPDFDIICENLEILNCATPAIFEAMNRFYRELWQKNHSDEQVKVTKMRIPSFDGALVNIQIIEPQSIGDQAPALIFYHGGNYLLSGMEHHIKLAREYALQASCKVFYLDYRLLPEAVFPTALYDAYHFLEWVVNEAEKQGVDRERIVVCGDNAGGNLAAGVSLMARDRHGPTIAGQMMIFPITDARQETYSINEYDDTPVWNSRLSRMMWHMLLKNSEPGIKQYTSVNEADCFENLPPTYIETAEFDCHHDEALEYADLLTKADIPVSLHQTKRTMLYYDIALDSSITEDSMAKRLAFLANIFSH